MEFPIIPFVENNLYIRENPVELYPYQKKFLLDKSPRRIVLKARQTGFSTLIAIEAILKSINPENTVLITSVSDRQALELMDKVNYFLKQLKQVDIEVKPGLVISPFELVRETKTEKIFNHGSRIISLPNSPQTICGYTATHAYIDEFGKFDSDQDVLDAIEPSLSRGGKLTLVSTPFGKRGKFYDIWMGKNDWSKHKVSWKDCPDKTYKKNVQNFKKKWGAVNFAQEYGLQFLSEGMGYFPPNLVNPCIRKTLSPEIQDKRNYIQFGMDIGKTKSNTALVIIEKVPWDYNKLTWRAEIRKIKLWKLGTDYDIIKADLKKFMTKYEPARVNIDSTGVGERLVEEIRKEQGSVIIPVKFSSSMKERMFSELRTLFENKQIIIPDLSEILTPLYQFERTATELGNIQYKGKHDDVVMALALSTLNMTRERPFMGVR